MKKAHAGTSPFFSSEVPAFDVFVRRIEAEPLWPPMTSICCVGVPRVGVRVNYDTRELDAYQRRAWRE